MLWPTCARRPLRARRFRVHAADAQLDASHAHLLEITVDFLRHPYRQIYKGVIFTDIVVADVAAVEPRFVCDGTDHISRLNAMDVADFNPVCLERRAVLT